MWGLALQDTKIILKLSQLRQGSGTRKDHWAREKNPETDPHIYGHLVLWQKQGNGERRAFSINCAGQLDIHITKMKVELFLKIITHGF